MLFRSRDEYSSSVQKILLDLRTEQPFDNPFDALREAVQRADQVAQSMAPRRSRTVGTIRQRPYMFGGHKQLAREIAWLAEARKIVYAVLKRDTAMTWWPERRILWSQHVAQLPRRLSRTRHKQPPELRIPFARLLETQTIPTLENWLVQAQEAIRCRQEAMRANFEQAVAENLKRLWGKVRADPSSLSSEMIQAALGKAPPQQRLWGISGHVPVGVELTLPPSSLPSALGTLTELSSTQWVQCVMGTEHGLRLWFRDRKSTRLNSSHSSVSRMPSSA